MYASVFHHMGFTAFNNAVLLCIFLSVGFKFGVFVIVIVVGLSVCDFRFIREMIIRLPRLSMSKMISLNRSY